MIKRQLLFAVIVGAMLIQESAKAQEVRGEHFLIRSAVILRLEPGLVNPIFDQLCGAAAGIRRTAPCPLTLTTVPTRRNFFPPRSEGALLPHLRLDIILKQMENRVVSGQGISIDQTDPTQFLYANWKIISAAATLQLPGADSEGYGFPAPNPGEIWPVGPYANGLFQGIIIDGCSPTTVFDVQLTSSIVKNSGEVGPGDTLAEVHLEDSVVGYGFYTFSYVIRAAEGSNVSDFIFTGDARSYCIDNEDL